MRVAIRVDASAEIGTGHVRRCLALAQALAALGASVWLLSRPLDTISDTVLRSSAFPVLWLAPPESGETPVIGENADLPAYAAWARTSWAQDARECVAHLQNVKPHWVWVDHYAFDRRWHAAVRQALGCAIAVMDDLADRMLDADLLVDQNWTDDHRVKYAHRLAQSSRVRLLGGPRFALLSANYRKSRPYVFHPSVRTIGIFMGGTDPDGVSARVLAVCRRDVGFAGPIEVVSLSANPYLPALRQACAQWPGTILTMDEPDLSAFFARHDLQVGAGGGATWERCCMGAPTIAVMVAANQAAVVPALAKLGALKAAVLEPRAGGRDTLDQVLRHLLHAPGERRRLSETARELVDGRGAERVALCLLCSCLRVRAATMADAALLHGWRNHPDVRSASTHGEEISLGDHVKWMQGVLADPARRLLVAEIGPVPVGCIRFDPVAPDVFEVSVYLDPSLQGLGLGPALLEAGEQALVAGALRAVTVNATVLAGNEPSRQLFTGRGYEGGPLAFSKRLPGPASHAK